MAGKLLLYMLSFFGVMASGPAVLLLAIFVFKFDLERAMVRYPWTSAITFALYGAVVIFMYFWLQDRFIVFRPEAGTPVSSRAQVVDRLEKAFTKPVEGAKLFDFRAEGDRAVITWSSSLNYFQITNVGGRGMKRIIVLTFDEDRHEAFFIMKDKDWRWNASKDFFNLSLNYSTGISAEYEMEIYPSIVFSESGGLKVDLKKLTYSSNELWNPVRTAILSSGWTVRGGMLPKFHQRVLLAVPFGLLCLLIGLLATGLAGPLYSKIAGSKKSAASKPLETARPDMRSTAAAPSANAGAGTRRPLPDNASPLEKMVRHMSTENVQVVLDGVVRTPPNYLNEEIRGSFVAYGKEYLSRPDRKEDFSSKLKKFAAKNNIGGLGE